MSERFERAKPYFYETGVFDNHIKVLVLNDLPITEGNSMKKTLRRKFIRLNRETLFNYK